LQSHNKTMKGVPLFLTLAVLTLLECSGVAAMVNPIVYNEGSTPVIENAMMDTAVRVIKCNKDLACSNRICFRSMGKVEHDLVT